MRIHRAWFMPLAAGAASAMLTASASALEIVPVEPFVGEHSEPLNQPFTLIAASIDVFGDAARLHSFDDEATAIHLLVSSTLGGDPVTPHTGSRILGFTTGPGVFAFEVPVRRFGAWWNTNGGADDATVEFFDPSGELLGVAIAEVTAAGNTWSWNGWESDLPVGSVRVTGNGLLDGFVWFDDLEMSVLAPQCEGDLDGSGVVDGEDLGALLATWGESAQGDVDGDGVTDGADLALLLASWGSCAVAR